MRLLRREDDGSFSLTEFIGHDTPRYAILSHTWGADNQEVTYQDTLQNMGHKKNGYKKLHFCADQTKANYLKYLWVDTCCRYYKAIGCKHDGY